MAVFIQNRQEFEQRLVIMKTQEGWSIRALVRHFAVSCYRRRHLPPLSPI